MPKEKTSAATIRKFEKALRVALNTPPEIHAPKKKTKAKRKRARQ